MPLTARPTPDGQARRITAPCPAAQQSPSRSRPRRRRPTSRTPFGFAQGRLYDPLSRLTGATHTGSYTGTFAYTYDAVGNRSVQTQTITSTVVTNYGYDIANRLTSVNGQTYTWDNNGNLLNDGTSTNTYDQANRLKTVTQGTNNFAFAYNGIGDRLRQSVNGITTTIYTLDPAAGLTQVLADGTSTYLYGTGRLAQ